MMNVVINDIHGILDCFGFYGISKQDFARIIEKFQESTTRIFVSPEYCKLRLEEAERINKENSLPIPYEYVSWKSLISDITALENNFEVLSKEWISKDLINETVLLYKFPDFQHWFFEEDDNSTANKLFFNLIKDLGEKNEYFINNQNELKSWLESNIDKFADQVFNEDIKNIYKNRLLDITYLLHFQDLQLFRDIAASLAWCITPENSYNIKTVPFFRRLIKRTILENFIRYQYKIDQQNNETSTLKKRKQINTSASLPDKDLSEVINILCN